MSDSAILSQILARLENIELSLNISGGGGNSGGVELPRSMKAFDAYIQTCLDPFVAICDKLGDDASVFGKITADAWGEMRNFLMVATVCKEPSQAGVQPLLQGIISKMKEMGGAIKRNDWELHGKVLQEGMSSLNWLLIKPAPRDYVESSIGGCDFNANKIRTKYKGNDDNQIAFCNLYKEVIKGLVDYIKEYHTTGVSWNKKPDAIDVADYKGGSTPAAAAAAPPKAAAPAPTPVPAAAAAPAPGARPVNLFASISKGADITAGLKKVTKDQQTWRAEYSAGEAPPPAPVALKKVPVKPKNDAPKGPPRLEFVNAEKKWYIENQTGPVEIQIEDNKPRVFIYGCIGAKVQIKGKCTSLIIDTCKKTEVVFETAMASCEVVNSQRMNVHVLNNVASVSIDKTDGIVIHLSETAMDTEVVTSKSSEMNISWMEGEELKERPIPEQFVHKVSADRNYITANISDLYSH